MRMAIMTAAIAAAGVGGSAQAAGEAPAPIVFFDIAGPDLARQAAFYREVFAWDVKPDGRVTTQVVGPLDGALRADPADKLIYLGVPDVVAALAKVIAHGGQVVAPRFEVKGVAVIGLFKDPAGNGMGLVEMRDGRPVVP